jgi:pimeloyl-ACP methyl ester carboxylesterase
MKLFIHGVPDTGYMWTPLLSALRLDDGSYLTPTLPGFDGTFPDGFTATKEAYLKWVIEMIEASAEVYGPLDLVGHDWGAPLCAVAAHARPELVRTWTIINAAPEPTFEWHGLARIWQTPWLGEIFMAVGSTARFRQQLISAGMPRDIAEHEAPRIDRNMKKAILRLYRSAKRPADWAHDFSSIAPRGLVLWGSDDPFVPRKVAQRFCERWHIALAIEEGVGHWGVCERPEAFAAHLRTHWDR